MISKLVISIAQVRPIALLTALLWVLDHKTHSAISACHAMQVGQLLWPRLQSLFITIVIVLDQYHESCIITGTLSI